MIIESILNGIKVVMMWLFNLIPAPEQTAGAGLGGVADTFVDIIQGVAYVLPVGDILIMLGIWYGIYTFTIGWKLIQRIWDALPFT